MNLAYVIDFDGTITNKDVTSVLVGRYGGLIAKEATHRYLKGEIGMNEWLNELVCCLPNDMEQLLSVALEASELMPGFKSFIKTIRDSGRRAYIASDGFGFYMETILEKHGILKYFDGVFGNLLTIRNNNMYIEIPHANPSCDRCGNCKAAHVVRLKDSGYRVVYIGNGFNDRYGASHADMIFARAGDNLAQYCRDHEMAFTPFNDFNDISGFVYPQSLSNPNKPLCDP